MGETQDLTSTTQRNRGLAIGAMAAFVLFAIGALVAASHRGIWLDEIWSIYEGQHDLNLGAAMRERWLAEISPPVFYFLSWLMTPLVGDDIVLRRTFNLVPLIAVAGALVFLARRHPPQRAFVALFGLLVMAHPASIEQFAEHRGYFTMLASSTVLAATLAIWLEAEDRDSAQPHLIGLSFASALVVFSMHYVIAFQIGVIVGVVIAVQWFANQCGQAIRLAIAMTAAGLPCVVTFFIQRGMLVDFAETGWIRTPWFGGFVIVGAALVATLVACMVAVAAILMRRDLLERTDPRVRVATILAGATAVSLGVLLALNAVQPIIVERYLAPYVPFLVAPVALLAARPIASERPLLIATVVVALLSIGLNARRVATETRWDGAAKLIAAQQARCPGTAVHAIPHWRFTERRLVVGPQEVEVMRMGIAMESRKFGLRIEPEPSRRIGTTCPTLVWVSHWYNPPVTVARIAERSSLPLDPAQVRGATLHDDGPWLVAAFPPR